MNTLNSLNLGDTAYVFMHGGSIEVKVIKKTGTQLTVSNSSYIGKYRISDGKPVGNKKGYASLSITNKPFEN